MLWSMREIGSIVTFTTSVGYDTSKLYHDTWYLILFLYQDTYHDTCIIDTPQHCLRLIEIVCLIEQWPRITVIQPLEPSRMTVSRRMMHTLRTRLHLLKYNTRQFLQRSEVSPSFWRGISTASASLRRRLPATQRYTVCRRSGFLLLTARRKACNSAGQSV